jgi:hypothetical protein
VVANACVLHRNCTEATDARRMDRAGLVSALNRVHKHTV